MGLLLRGARVVDPAIGIDGVTDVLIKGRHIEAVGENIHQDDSKTLDLDGKVLVPGLVDMHVHLREPGYEYKETIESGTRAAVRGGFTGVAPMPNTDPVCDTGPRIQFIVDEALEHGFCKVYPVGAITSSSNGKTLAEMGDMVSHGAVAFTDDGHGVQDDGVMRRAMDYAKMFPRTVMDHCQRTDLVGAGVVNEGVVSTRLGMAGWPAEGEEIEIARDIALCGLTGCPLHIQHITTARGMQLVCEARDKGLPVTCEITPHHLFCCEDDISDTYDTNLKVNPPLRTHDDMLALQEALCTGRIDCIVTDHAPHAAHEKALEFELAPFGTTGLETALPLVLTNLVSTGRLSYSQLVEVMAINPRKILGLDQVRIEKGATADLTVIDPDEVFTVDENDFESLSANSAFIGQKLCGRAYYVYVDGRAVLKSGKVVR